MFCEQPTDENPTRLPPRGDPLACWIVGLESSAVPGRTVFPLLMLYVALLAAFATFANASVSLHHDTTELWAWGKEFELGYAKHPPLAAWLAGAWFQVMPREDWSAYLLASVNVGVGLAGAWMVAGVFLGPLGRLASVLFLALTPAYSLWALKFNVNAPLISIWPWAGYFFLKSLETRRIGFGVCAGLLCGMALLTKYYSVILLGTLFLVALSHPDRRVYFTSAAPYIGIVAGVLVLAPHAWWTMASHFVTFDYAVSKTEYAVVEARANTIKAVAGSICSLGIAIGAYAIAFGGQFRGIVMRALAGTLERRNAWLICLANGPLLLTIAAYLLANARIATGYLLPAFFATPIVLLVVGRAEITVPVLRRLVVCAAAIWLPLLLASPVLGGWARPHAPDSRAEPIREVAIEATRVWRRAFETPLRIVAGDMPLATGVAFYSPDTPSYLIFENPEHSPWVSTGRMRREGVLFVCRTGASECIGAAETFTRSEGIPHRRELVVPSFLRGTDPHRFVLIARPPDSWRPSD